MKIKLSWGVLVLAVFATVAYSCSKAEDEKYEDRIRAYRASARNADVVGTYKAYDANPDNITLVTYADNGDLKREIKVGNESFTSNEYWYSNDTVLFRLIIESASTNLFLEMRDAYYFSEQKDTLFLKNILDSREQILIRQ